MPGEKTIAQEKEMAKSVVHRFLIIFHNLIIHTIKNPDRWEFL